VKLLAPGFQLGSCGAGSSARALRFEAQPKAKGGSMDFRMNDHTYYVSLSEDERKWRVLVSTPTGSWRIPVYEDVEEAEPTILLEPEEEKHRLPN
jgi:hypothetical protein